MPGYISKQSVGNNTAHERLKISQCPFLTNPCALPKLSSSIRLIGDAMDACQLNPRELLSHSKKYVITFNCSAVCALSSSRTMLWLPASTASSSGTFPLCNTISRISFFHSFCRARSLFNSMKLNSSFCRSLEGKIGGGLRNPDHIFILALLGAFLLSSFMAPVRLIRSSPDLIHTRTEIHSMRCLCTNYSRHLRHTTARSFPTVAQNNTFQTYMYRNLHRRFNRTIESIASRMQYLY